MMATAQASTSTLDVQPSPTSSQFATIHNVISNGASTHRVSPSRSRPSTADSNRSQTTGQPVPVASGPPSNSIHHGANLILDLIKAERRQASEDAQRQIILLKQQHNQRYALYSRELSSVSTKQRDSEQLISHLSNERDRYLKEVTDVQTLALQARADALAARGQAYKAVKAADDARSHLTAVQDALQQVGINVSQGDAESPNHLKITLGTQWLELVPAQTHCSDISIADTSACDNTSSLPLNTQHLTSPLNFISFIRELCKNLDWQHNQSRSDVERLLEEKELRASRSEDLTHALKKEQGDSVRAKEEAVAALEEMKKTMTESFKSTLEQRLQDQLHQAEANAKKDRQALESSIEEKTGHIRELRSQLAQSMTTLDEWKGKYDAIAKERDSQQQLHVAELQKCKEAISGRMASQIDDLQKRLEVSSSKALAFDGISKTKESRIEELEKELASLREHYAKSCQDKDEAVTLVKSRDAKINKLKVMLAESSIRNVTTESAPKNSPDGSSAVKKFRMLNARVEGGYEMDQDQLRTQHVPKMSPTTVSTEDGQVGKQIPAPKKIDKQKSKSSSLAGSPVEIDLASWSDVEIIERPPVTSQVDTESSNEIEIISGPIPSPPQRTFIKLKMLRPTTRLIKTALRTSSDKACDTVSPWKTSLKRVADVDDSSSQAIKRHKLSLDTSLKDKVSSAASNSRALTPMGSESSPSSPSSPVISGSSISSRRPAQTSNSASSGRGTSSKKAVAHLPSSRMTQSTTPAEAPSAGASDSLKDDVGHESSSVDLETRIGPPKQPARRPLAKPLARRGKMIKPWPLTVGKTTDSKKQAEFKNFKPSDVPAKEQPSVSSARPTEEQRQDGPSAASPASTEAPSSSSSKNRPSLSRQISSKDPLSATSSNTLPRKSISTLSARTADQPQDNPSRDSTPKSNPRPVRVPARPIPKRSRPSAAASQANEESPHKTPWGPKSMSSGKSS